jgi:MFS family permease
MVREMRCRPIALTFDRNVYILLLYTLGKGLQLTINSLSINLYAYSLGFRSEFIGVLTGMPSVGALVAGAPMGMLADRIGRKPLILISGALTPLSLIAIALSSNGPLLLAAGFANGVCASAYWVTQLPLLTESTTEQQRMTALSINSFLLVGVGALGSLIGGAVPEFVGGILHVPAASTIPLRWSVLASAIVAGAPAIPLVLLREPRRMRSAAAVEIPAALDAAAPAGVARQRQLESAGRWGVIALFVMLLIPDVIFVTGESSVIGLEQLFFRLKFQLQPGTLGNILTVTGLIGGATALVTPRIVRRWSKLRAATALQLLAVPMVLGIGFAPSFIMSAGFELGRSVLRGLFEPIYAGFVMESISTRRRGALSGFYGITWGVGYSTGSSIAGLLQPLSLSLPFVMGAGCLILAPSLLLAFFARRPVPKQLVAVAQD